MAFQSMLPLVKAPVKPYEEAIERWMHQHPVPTAPIEAPPTPRWNDYTDNVASHRRLAEEFTAKLPQGNPPSPAGWE